MAKAKKKKRGGFLGLLQQSFSGWKKLAKYAASGKWANDISKAIHRGGAGKRAKQAAQSRSEYDVEMAKRIDSEWQTEIEKLRPKPVRKITQQQIDDAGGSLWAAAHGGKVVKPKTSASTAVRQAIAKVPTETTVIAHDRTGTKNGVQSHKKKVSKADHQASVAAELLCSRQSSKKYEGVKSDYDRLPPDQQEARDAQRNKSNKRQRSLRLEALSKDVSQDHIDRAREFLLGAFEEEDDREQIAKLTHAQVVKATDRYHDGGWDTFSRTAQQDDRNWEKSLEAKRKS